MNFTFSTPAHGTCVVKLWATGRYGFSLPKKVEIAAPDGPAGVFLYFNKKLGLQTELSNRAIVRIAIASFLAGAAPGAEGAELDTETAPYDGPIVPLRLDAPRAPMRVRPGPAHARAKAQPVLDPA